MIIARIIKNDATPKQIPTISPVLLLLFSSFFFSNLQDEEVVPPDAEFKPHLEPDCVLGFHSDPEPDCVFRLHPDSESVNKSAQVLDKLGL